MIIGCAFGCFSSLSHSAIDCNGTFPLLQIRVQQRTASSQKRTPAEERARTAHISVKDLHEPQSGIGTVIELHSDMRICVFQEERDGAL